MPRRERPAETRRSEHWIRVAVNEFTGSLNASVCKLFCWDESDRIEWLSPIESDQYAEYYDQEFIDRLRVAELSVPLHKFWPKGGPRWDGLARNESGKLLLVEAKAYIEEAIDYRTRADRGALASSA